MITGQTIQGVHTATITGELNIYTAAECCAQLRHMIDDNTSIVLDLSAVSEIDTAGIQLLLQVRRTCHAQGRSLQFVSPSPVVQEVVQLLQLRELLDMPCVEHTSPAMQDDTP